MPLVEEILTAVASLAMGGKVFIGTLPASPAVCTAVILTGGFFDVSNPTRFPTFQVVHRNTNVQSGGSFVSSLNAGLANTWDALPTIPCRIEAVTEPGAYVYVNDKLALWSLNYRVTTMRP